MKAVIFDFGDVLVDWQPYRAVAHIITRHEWEQFVEEADFYGFCHRTDQGADFHEELRKLGEDNPRWAWILPEFHRCFAATIAGEVPYMESIVAELKAQGIHCYGLTNWPELTVPFSAGAQGIRLMEDTIISGIEKIAKPDPQIFHLACERFQLNPEDVIFIDDKSENVEAAKSIGMDGFVFQDAVDTARNLRQRGISIAFAPDQD